MNNKAPVIGLTGGIGSGKTAVSDAFAEKGITVVDADVVARQIVEPGTPALKAIEARFGESVLNSDRTLNRAALRQQVFNCQDDKTWLNTRLHPAIREEMRAQIDKATSPYVILAVPLLIENGLDAMTDYVLVVDCPEQLQLARALQRDGSDEATIRNIIKAQATREQRLLKADDVIDNSADMASLSSQVNVLHNKYLTIISRR